MMTSRGLLPGTAWLCLTAAMVLTSGCAQQGAWSGIYAVDAAGGARICVAPAAAPADGQSIAAQMQVSNEGGWCGINATRGGSPFESYLQVARPTHGTVFAHRVGTKTRIDYTPDAGFAGTDSFAVRLLPGQAVIQVGVTVTK